MKIENFKSYVVDVTDAKTLKKLGYNELCMILWKSKKYYSATVVDKDSSYISIPLYEQVFDWFRDNHDLYTYIEEYHESLMNTGKPSLCYKYIIIGDNEKIVEIESEFCDSKIKAKKEALRKLISLI